MTCSVTNCDKPSRTKGLCPTHYSRLLRHGHTEQTRVRGACSLPDCDQPHSSLGYCQAHAAKQRRYGDPTTVRMGKGELNPNWQGDTIGYVGAHKRVHRERGPAAQHTCVDCGGQAAQWSYNGLDPNEQRGPSREGFESSYSTDLSHYVPRCVPCHIAHDKQTAAA